VVTADMRTLPFADGTFDVVVSSLAIHNIRSNAARAEAVAEAWRVLRAGGRLVIADIRSTSRYAATLRTRGADSVSHRRLGWQFWYGNPFAATSLVTACKRERRLL
jgi:arsenite methyltransferase